MSFKPSAFDIDQTSDPPTAPSTPSSPGSDFQDDLLDDEPTVEQREMSDSPAFVEDEARTGQGIVVADEFDGVDSQPTGDAIASPDLEAGRTISSKNKGKGKAQPEGIDVGGWVVESNAASGVGVGGGKKEPLLDEALVKSWNKDYAGIVDRMAYPSGPAVELSPQRTRTSS